ncbi:unnamed protein product [Rotaria sp. Silwood1]|nr:unnamed protein product [Rotaria sp. Silwood1]
MTTVKLTETLFGTTKNHNEIKKYTLSTSDGFEVALINYGATIQSIRQPNKHNQITEITLGYDDLQGYVDDKYFFGCTVGRVTNRIKNGRFELDGTTYELPKNDSEDGFSGRVDVTVKYRLTCDHRLILDYHATTTKPTPINMTNHVFFNLAGDASGSVLDHQLMVPAENIISLDEENIPTGGIASVENTPYDFRTLTRVGDRINESFDGYDIMFIVDGNGKRPFGKLVDQQSGRAITIESTQKGLQFYTGNYLDGGKGRNGTAYNKHDALCLEAQNFTDSVNNQPLFPSIILRPGQEYHEQTTFHFHLE